jgi:glutamate dehydrogenase
MVHVAAATTSSADKLQHLLFADLARDGADRPDDRDMRDLADASFAWMAERQAGRAKIKVRRVTGAKTPFTVLQIVNDDMPFLVDSVMGAVQACGLMARQVLHPILKVERTGDGVLQAITGSGDQNWADGRQESLILVLLDDIDDAVAGKLTTAVELALADVRLAVNDWPTMVGRFEQTVTAAEDNPPPIAPGLMAETLAFCRWLRDGHFTFLGCRAYRLAGPGGQQEQVPVDGSGLGVLRDPSLHILSRNGDALAMTPDIAKFMLSPQPLIIAKANIMSRVHRCVLMDYVGLKTYARDGGLAGELRMVGLFTSKAYTETAQSIPFLRHKVEHAIVQSGFAPGSHAAKAVANVIETFPRDELFQIGDGQLLEWARGIVDLELRPRVRVFARHDRFDRYVSALVYIQRDRYSTAARERMTQLLSDAFAGQVTTFTPFFPEGPLVRVHFTIARHPGTAPAVDIDALEHRIADATRPWDDKLKGALAALGQSAALLDARYARAFSAGYAETFSAARAVEDIGRIERLTPEGPVAIDFYREPIDPPTRVRAAIYRFDKPIPLSDRVPVLENLGFSVIDERSYRVRPQFADGAREVALHDMVLETADGAPLDLTRSDERMEDCYLAVNRGEADNDPFNSLVLMAGADWRDVAVIRAYAAYMRQIRSPFGLRYIAETINRHAGMARDLIELFHLRFDPGRKLDMAARTAGEATIRTRIDGALALVQSLDEDRILRSYLNLITVTLRTNFYQTDAAGLPPQTLAFKLDSKLADGAPEPRPFREIWVYSPRVEGIHLRFAAIARGGIRWSDRAQDFRTEVLGLCKAQQVKNTVIVPAGAKGGFLPKQMPRGASRDETMKEGIASYRIFISALLDITDNLIDGAIVPPPNVVRHEPDDPYLVVAADKGTATFSDFANALAVERGFWLGDAFASGGSAGYDHKKMAITARGAWECVKRHFRETEIDIQTTPFRVTGVGDMSGDVFGNGMLLSPAIKLLAAFDHRDIFIDPTPDAAISFAERKRLFDLPRSSWQDYDKAKISAGGGVFARTAKSVPLSPQIRTLLGLEAATLTPVELMNAILKCETDLLWFGGIGTYVRASTETDEQAGDRANDAIRVAASDLRAKVIGEGANLGITQRGRIEFSAGGGRINTDFIDNSAGVNSSDQEVNIKVALAPAVAAGRLPAAERSPFLAAMTDDVAAACLVNNIHQSLAISLAERRAAKDAGYYVRLMSELENRGLLSRKLEALPSNAELRAREASGQGLTRPELAVLLSLSKIALDHDLLASAVPDNPACQPFLVGYFPKALQQRFPADLKTHRLRREIIATFVVNAVINRGGPAFVVRLADETGRTPADIACAFLAARSFLDLSPIWSELHGLAGKIGGQRQLDLYARTQDALRLQTAELLRAGAVDDIAGTAARNLTTMTALTAHLDAILPNRQRTQHQDFIEQQTKSGVPAALAARLSMLGLVGSVPALTGLAATTGRPVTDVASIAFAATEHLRIDEIRARALALKISDHYDRLAIDSALSSFEAAAHGLTKECLQAQPQAGVNFASWAKSQGPRLARLSAIVDEIAGSGEISVSRLTVAAARLQEAAPRS